MNRLLHYIRAHANSAAIDFSLADSQAFFHHWNCLLIARAAVAAKVDVVKLVRRCSPPVRGSLATDVGAVLSRPPFRSPLLRALVQIHRVGLLQQRDRQLALLVLD